MLDEFNPSVSLAISYPLRHESVDLGNKIKPSKVDHAPDVYIHPDITRSLNTTYTLVLSDPDALSRDNPVKAQMCHWIITNITLSHSSTHAEDIVHLFSLTVHETTSRKGRIVELMSYFPPSPPAKTGYHRYVFALLASRGDARPAKQPKAPKSRPHWGYGKIGAGIREWAEENELAVLGE